MNYKSEEEAVVERLADLMLGERLPLDICKARGEEVIIPANKTVTKSLLKGVYLAFKNEELEIDPSPIRNKVLETIDSAITQFGRQQEKAKAAAIAAKADPGIEM